MLALLALPPARLALCVLYLATLATLPCNSTPRLVSFRSLRGARWKHLATQTSRSRSGTSAKVRRGVLPTRAAASRAAAQRQCASACAHCTRRLGRRGRKSTLCSHLSRSWPVLVARANLQLRVSPCVLPVSMSGYRVVKPPFPEADYVLYNVIPPSRPFRALVSALPVACKQRVRGALRFWDHPRFLSAIVIYACARACSRLPPSFDSSAS